MANNKEISITTIDELAKLFDSVSPKELSRNISENYFSYVNENIDAPPPNFHQVSNNIKFLLNFLEVAEEEINK